VNDILITSYNSPNIIPELINLVNEKKDEFSVNELWIIKTGPDNPNDEISEHGIFTPSPIIRYWFPSGVLDTDSPENCSIMKELIYRVLLTAHEKKDSTGKIHVSITGGRKNMSADLQQAVQYLGADSLFHLLQIQQDNSNWNSVMPVFIDKDIQSKTYLKSLNKRTFQVDLNESEFHYLPDNSLVEKINQLRMKTENLYSNYERLHQTQKRENFHKLSFLSPEIILMLQDYRIGLDPNSKKEELLWLRKLPKTELHCHFGGTANPQELVQIAGSMTDEIQFWRASNSFFDKWCFNLRKIVISRELSSIEKLQKLDKLQSPEQVKNIHLNHSELPEPVAVCAFLQSFANEENLLLNYIYRELTNSDNFSAIGIDKYASLGDLQGSSLLQSEKTIRENCRIISRQCKENNIRYFEIRCSPQKYTRNNLSMKEVVEIIIDELEKSGLEFRLILIAGRDKKLSEIHQIIEFAEEQLRESSSFKHYFGGMDLAGPEHTRSPEEIRHAFYPLMENCSHITIHAGEGEDVSGIWQAVYLLNADRIGHGLTLKNRPDLFPRFIDRNIAVEMCPSSNHHIVGFKKRDCETSDDFDIYPLSEYIAAGILVTINTDDPGISLTDLTNEYYSAAAMSPNGLSAWEILQIIKNGFKASFLSFFKKKVLLEECENLIYDLIKKGDILS